jgi:HPr kinase/phosphorylase
LVESRGSSLALELLTTEADLERAVGDPDISSPGLALAGYTRRFPGGRMQVFGETEMTYLASLDDDEIRSRLDAVFSFDVPAVFITKGQRVPEAFLEVATRRNVPTFRTALTTKDFYRKVKPYLEAALAPTTTLHGSLADVHGVGLLFVGKSGVGKSECVLDLVERGHRLVADDLVMVSRRGNDVLIGKGHELQRHHMEIRGVGIIDVRALFGIRAIRQQKRLEVVVQLEHWDEARAYTRTGLELDEAEILGVPVPRVTIPLNPGKNITVIAEVIAMNHLLRYSGVNSALAFDERLRESMRPVSEYLEQDYE